MFSRSVSPRILWPRIPGNTSQRTSVRPQSSARRSKDSVSAPNTLSRGHLSVLWPLMLFGSHRKGRRLGESSSASCALRPFHSASQSNQPHLAVSATPMPLRPLQSTRLCWLIGLRPLYFSGPNPFKFVKSTPKWPYSQYFGAGELWFRCPRQSRTGGWILETNSLYLAAEFS